MLQLSVPHRGKESQSSSLCFSSRGPFPGLTFQEPHTSPGSPDGAGTKTQQRHQLLHKTLKPWYLPHYHPFSFLTLCESLYQFTHHIVGLSVCMCFSSLKLWPFESRDHPLSFLYNQCPAWDCAVKFSMSLLNERKKKWMNKITGYRGEEDYALEDNLKTFNLILLYDFFLAVLLWIWNLFILKFIYCYCILQHQ